ncbi:preprotein translocase subunit SecE [Candidatus Woesebacteria bacterium RIFOXYD1_FULL_46_19]|uniref:Protein translocase subunit SecE n=2 Tax=Candidatus Woeseibacteriota TaxID=1752722 RepID=A0A1F8DN12_9BACT|nr:MAG: preprotein translocase subunit SecE [Candidatus Woesebacteria bacterium RIFOXYA1_FULL_48_16]OGM89175.1 MAG: preprotein translocase subunit SecE [Candidatus Woesebacteria bacterium RIFOXYD1_FULL_46_19]
MLKLLLVKSILSYLSEVRLELSKVTWPKRNDVIKLTLIVFIISAIVGGYTGALDYLFTKLLEFFVAR